MKSRISIWITPFIMLAAMGLTTMQATAQITVPQLQSPRGRTAAQIGVTWVTIDYGRPSVRGREVWGKLVPYGMVWRAGANVNTIFEVTTDVTVEGKPLAAGRYGLHVIPFGTSKGEGSLDATVKQGDWVLIFSKDADAWGSFFYDESNDALRVGVTPSTTMMNTEVLTYDFPEVANSSATVELRWEHMALRFKVEVDLASTVANDFQRQLTGVAGFTASNFSQAAAFMMNNNLPSPYVEQWLERAERNGPDFQASLLKARLAMQKGDIEKATFHRKQAVSVANNTQLNAYGYQLLQAGKTEEAIEAFVVNAERNPTDPNVWDSLGEAYAMAKMKDKAIECFKKSLSMNPPDAVRQNSQKWLEQLQ